MFYLSIDQVCYIWNGATNIKCLTPSGGTSGGRVGEKAYTSKHNHFSLLFFKDFIYLFLERGEGREKERERNISAWLPLVQPLLGTWPTTQHVP